jgi:CRISPR/Cas system-associated exonuclease Cas4 (RecB family)
MIQQNKQFEYPQLERVTRPDGVRHYICDKGIPHASVTTILGATEDKTGLMEWRAWVGDKKADQIRDDACSLGTLMHTHLENWMMGEERPGGSNVIRKMATNMADQIIERGLTNVSEVWAMEEMLYFPGLYAGTADLIGIHNGEPAIMDYKTTNKMKSKDKINNYACQLAAYALAHNELFGTNIKRGVIFMVARDLSFQEYVFEGEEFEKAIGEWMERLEMFFNQSPASPEQP